MIIKSKIKINVFGNHPHRKIKLHKTVVKCRPVLSEIRVVVANKNKKPGLLLILFLILPIFLLHSKPA